MWGRLILLQHDWRREMKVRDLNNYSFGGETALGFDEAVIKVTEALKEEGFGERI